MLDDRALFNDIEITERHLRITTKKSGMFPSLMCRPILKDIEHVKAIQSALKNQATFGWKKFGLGTDTAPHDHAAKYREACACGEFTAPIALQMYAIAFEQIGILDHLPAFACDIMSEFYGIKDKLPRKDIVLIGEEMEVAENYNGITSPFAGKTISWSVK